MQSKFQIGEWVVIVPSSELGAFIGEVIIIKKFNGDYIVADLEPHTDLFFKQEWVRKFTPLEKALL